MALTDDLIAFFELEEASGTRDDAHSTNDLTDNATVTQATGKVGNAAQFTAANSEYLSHADNAALSTGDIDYTVAAWVYLDTEGFYPIINKYGNAGDREYLLYFDSSADRFDWRVYGATGFTEVVANTFGAVATGTWYYVVAWHDATNNLAGLAINAGTADTTATGEAGIDSTGPLLIGGEPTFLGWFWNGRIDQVGFWKRVLTSQERTDLYNGGAGLSYAAMSGAAGDAVPQAWAQYRARRTA